MRRAHLDKLLMPHGRLARAAAAVAFFACAGAVAGAPSASRGVEPPSGPCGEDSGSEPVPVRTRPVVLVMPSGDAHLVLAAGPEQLDGQVVWQVLYVAGSDPAELRQPDADARLASIDRDLAEAFGPMAEVAQATRVLVTAVFGEPGERGAIEQRAFVRDAATWRADGDVRRQTVARVPGPQVDVVRDPAQEARARNAAGEFLSSVSRADYGAAWARTSEVVKVVMGRTEFERRVAALGCVSAPRDQKLHLAYAASERPFVPGRIVEAWLACHGAHHGVRALALRLDNDMEWRVAGIAQLTSAPVRPETAAAL